jgi:hypothetical protein
MNFDFKQTLPELGLQESTIPMFARNYPQDNCPESSSIKSMVTSSEDSQSIFSDDSRQTLSTHATTIGQPRELALYELVHLFALDKELVSTYTILSGPEAFRLLQQKFRNLLKDFAIELSVELETELKSIPSFIREQRHRLSRRVCELLQPHQGSLPQDFSEQVIDKDDILNSYFHSMLDVREPKSRVIE